MEKFTQERMMHIMTNKFNHSTFGGFIHPSDFETERGKRVYANGSAIARRIAWDFSFDEQCRKNIENRKRK